MSTQHDESDAIIEALEAELEALKAAVRWLAPWSENDFRFRMVRICENTLNPPPDWIESGNPERDKVHAQTLLKVLEGEESKPETRIIGVRIGK